MSYLRSSQSWILVLAAFGGAALLFAVGGRAASTGTLAPSSGALFGAYVPGGQGGVTSFESSIGRKLGIDHRFWGWNDSWPTSTYESWDVANGRIPMVSWDGPNTTLANIINGSQDSVIRSRANAVKSFGYQILIRWGYEMNGTWFAWGGSNNGNDPSKYVAAWRHIVDLFRSVGATNALWVWAPNVGDNPKVSWNHWTNYYPGDNYVDWVGIDGYNWGTSQTWSSWQSFAQIFGGSSSIYNDYNGRKPIMIAESGSVEQGGDKGAWWKDVPTQLKTNFTGIKAVVFLNDIHNGTDWRAQTTTNSLNGYRAMVADSWLNPGASTTATSAPVNTAAPTISGTPTQGQTLTSSTGTWSGSPTSYTYQWQRCDTTGASCASIASATASSIVLSASDVGSTVRVAVTTTNNGGTATAASAATASVAPPAVSVPSMTMLPTVSGTAGVGQTLTASNGTWSGSPTTYAYQWQRSGSYADLVKASSPLAYWRFAEASGTAASDSSGNGNNGTYSGVTLGAPGALAGDPNTAALYASGQTSFGNRFAFSGTAPFSLEAWIKPTRLDTTYRRLFAKEAVIGGKREGFLLWLRSDGIGFERWSGGSQSIARSTTSLPLNAYSHVAATYDGATLRLYVNGTLLSSTTSTLPLATTSAPFVVGSSSYGSNPIVGSVDEAAVYGSALSSTTIAAHAHAAAVSGTWTNIAAATGVSYTVASSDAGYHLHVVVSASNSAGMSSVASNATAVVAP